MRRHHVTTAALLFSTLSMSPVALHAMDGQNGLIEIRGDYRYAARESESAAEARAIACREAWRQAISNSSLYREQTASVIDSPLLRDLTSTLAAHHVQDRHVIEQTERGRTIICTVKGMLPVEEATRLIRAQLTGGPSPADSIDQNRALRILTVHDEANGTIAIQYQALKRLDWLGTHYQGGLRESADIMVDFYDEAGRLIKTEQHAARRTPAGDDVMNPGAVALLTVTKPAGAKTFRVWLVK